jgi:hypothetical protein
MIFAFVYFAAELVEPVEPVDYKDKQGDQVDNSLVNVAY